MRFDPDLYSKVAPTINRIKEVLDRSGTDDQLAQVSTWAEEFQNDLDDVSASLSRAQALADQLVVKLQAILDRILP
jgi:hypothetical protein